MKKIKADPHISTSALKIALFGSCQVRGSARLMQAMTEGVTATGIKLTDRVIADLRSNKFDVVTQVLASDIIFVQRIGEISNLIRQQFPAEFHKIRYFPVFSFNAYHPDAIYITSRKNGQKISGPLGYQSAIAFGGWVNGLSVEEAISLFRDEVFDALGYYGYWDISRNALNKEGEQAGFDMSNLLENWHRQGCWLYTFNHPKLFALADVSRRLLNKEGIDTLSEAESSVEDALARAPGLANLPRDWEASWDSWKLFLQAA